MAVTNRTQQHDNERPQSHPSPSVRESLRALQTPIRFLKGVGPKRAAQLEASGLVAVEDLLYHLPFRYEDRRRLAKLSEAAAGQEQTFVGQLVALQSRFNPRVRRNVVTAVLRDETATIDLVWYRAPSYLVKGLAQGQRLLVHGKVETAPARRHRLVHPEFEILETGEEQHAPGILPIYVRPGGLSLSILRKWLSQALAEYVGHVPGCLPAEILERRGLINIRRALTALHEPAPNADLDALNTFSSTAHRSVIFDELFYLQLGLGLRKNSRHRCEATARGPLRDTLTTRMRQCLPFSLTAAQERVLDEIENDLESPHPMQRLVQGDVGSGKTMVAWMASLRLIENGYQCVWMAPTEMLAEQHYRNLHGFADSLGIQSGLLTASTPAKEKKLLLARTGRAEIQFLVGTHALIQDNVCVPRMGLGVIDEQHRFGVMQRFSLQRLTGGGAPSPLHGSQPHMLLMSATPIPRSMAMVLYGDMEVSFVDEMPPGRTAVQTKVFRAPERREVYACVLEELRRGHQAFIVYPLVEASEQLEQVRDATQMAEKMRQSAFKEFGVALVHGRMAAAERDEVMRAFRDGKVGVLVATTVIEVGIDIPNATVIVIEHAERFGLSQLHQLRGRVGRGLAPGHCLLVNRGGGGGLAAQRLRAMEKEHDGFKIAEADLLLRGPGEFMGTRQSGLADFRLANLIRDRQLLTDARAEALAWLEKDPQLRSRDSGALRAVLKHRWGQRLQLGAVG
ncbi:MAG: ATP-dependent DNA helicase RecG [Alphaproteobacteria bacterium]